MQIQCTIKKVCSKCGDEKPTSEFYNKTTRGKKGLNAKCKTCVNEEVASYKAKNEQKIKDYKAQWAKDNKDTLNVRNKAWKEANPQYFKDYLEAYRPIAREKSKQWYNDNLPTIMARAIAWNKANRDKVNKRRNARRKEQRTSGHISAFEDRIRKSIMKSIKRGSFTKSMRTQEALGCSFQGLIDHLNSNRYGFEYGMTDLDIDHIIPLCAARTEVELMSLWHYSNLQLLPSFYNRHVKN